MNNYSIIALGSSGSGKTIFLASLFKVFSTQGRFGFSLDVQDHAKRIALNKIYADLTTGEEWPPGTKNISEWVLTAYVNNSGGSKIPACKITYVDFKGGILTDVPDDEGTYGGYDSLETYVKEADVVLAILDGQKLLSFMQDHELTNKFVLRWLHEDLPNLMQMVDSCNKYTAVHFIISKWDLIDESIYSLADVKKRLLDNVREFNNVVENRRKVGYPVRLIPVSSLGKGFARLQSDGQMKKIAVNPHPMNVEFPLAFALTDNFRYQAAGGSGRQPFKLTVWDWIVVGFCIVLTLAQGLGLIIAVFYFSFRLSTNNQTKTSNICNISITTGKE